MYGSLWMGYDFNFLFLLVKQYHISAHITQLCDFKRATTNFGSGWTSLPSSMSKGST